MLAGDDGGRDRVRQLGQDERERFDERCRGLPNRPQQVVVLCFRGRTGTWRIAVATGGGWGWGWGSSWCGSWGGSWGGGSARGRCGGGSVAGRVVLRDVVRRVEDIQLHASGGLASFVLTAGVDH